ncbi:hypothetical protein PF004_g31611 [Phytophthora fragariae]|uniref:Uncharacterized protein n=1 Tax=Phytophthora fragariae TaxID=53985 RepID=A0A6G0M990_9STRA|nr:hypothetical protein PF004_g31611 [Phytophthora fragariae]
MTAQISLGLALAWTRTRGAEYVLCMLFGVTDTCALSFYGSAAESY